jgi:diguanylate cyclase (GGDEF)-like protein/PAS domain S-box-containing protein
MELEMNQMNELKELLQQLKDCEALKVRCERAEEAQARLEAVVASLDDAIVSSTLDGTITTWNPGGRKIYGYSEEEIFGRPISLLLSPGHRDEIPAILSKIARGERLEHYETVGMRTDGKPIRISLGVFPIKEVSGQVIGVSWVARDITDQIRLVAALRSRKERLREMQNSITDAYFALDYQWRFLEMNHVAETIFNSPANELIGKVLWDKYPEAIDTEFYQQSQKAVAARKPVHTEARFHLVDRLFEIHIYPRRERLEIYFRDITERKHTEEVLRKSEELSRSRLAELQVIYATAPIGLCFVDANLRYVSINEKLAAMNGLSVEEHLGRTVCRAVPLLVDLSEPYLQRVIDTGESVEELEIHGTTPAQPGVERDWLANFYPVRNEAGGMLGVNVVVQEITERKRVEGAMRFQALHDPLTELPNRMLFMDRLNLELAETRRNRKMLAVMFLDLDNFKNINDTLGHSIGDKLLKEVAGRLKTCMRETDTIARIGGDEFNMLLADISHADDAVPIAKKIMSLFKGPFDIDNQELYVTASIGISICPNDGESAEALLKNADIAMYHAKEQGRNNYQFHSAAVNTRTLERMLLENDLRQMIECGELVLHYQPQLNVDSRQILCAEALVRWRHPKLGLLSPSRFLPIAEEIGVITLIDEWVLRTACTQAMAWQEAGYKPIRVTVNLSTRQFQKSNLVKMISRILEETGLAPELLELDITESAVMQNIEFAVANLASLADIGIGISVDDFGLSFSCLSALRRLHVQKLKIDKSFIRELKVDAAHQAIVNAMIAVAHTMNLEVVAEGVETDDQLTFLHVSGCNEMQGYLLGGPLPSDEFEKLAALRS